MEKTLQEKAEQEMDFRYYWLSYYVVRKDLSAQYSSFVEKITKLHPFRQTANYNENNNFTYILLNWKEITEDEFYLHQILNL